MGQALRRLVLPAAAGGAIAALALTAGPPAPQVTHDVIPVLVTPRSGASGVDVIFTSKGTASPLVRSLRVFSEPRRMEDVLPPELQRLASFLRADAARSRLLVASDGIRIYGLPNERGEVCYLRDPLGDGSCLPALVDGAFPRVDAWHDAWGLLDDGAVRVDVQVRGRWTRATLGRNAFLLRLPRNVAAPTRIVSGERDGARHVYEIRRCRPSDISPLSRVSPLSEPPC